MSATLDNETRRVPPAQQRRRRPLRETLGQRRNVRRLVILLVVLVAGIAGYRYWRNSQLYVTTDNAYVNANTIEIAAQVSGPVAALHVRDNDSVSAGAVLFEIDPRPYQLALDKAQAQLQLATQGVSESSAAVSAAQAQLAQRRAELAQAQSNERRENQLVASGFISKQAAETAHTQVQTAVAAVGAAEAALEKARSALGATGPQNANVRAAEAAVNQARLDLERTVVRSPASGRIAKLTLRPGDIVQPGAPLFMVISDQEYWVDANFKESELRSIPPGDRAKIRVDMYPQRTFDGVVESLSGGSGAAFSLLPPQNASGNWVKVTQRVPVRIRFTDTDARYPLRIGTTAKVTVDLQSAPAR